MVKGSILGSGPQVFPHRGNLSVALKRISRIKKTSRPWAVSSAHAAGQMVTGNGRARARFSAAAPKPSPVTLGLTSPTAATPGPTSPQRGPDQPAPRCATSPGLTSPAADAAPKENIQRAHAASFLPPLAFERREGFFLFQ